MTERVIVTPDVDLRNDLQKILHPIHRLRATVVLDPTS